MYVCMYCVCKYECFIYEFMYVCVCINIYIYVCMCLQECQNIHVNITCNSTFIIVNGGS